MSKTALEIKLKSDNIKQILLYDDGISRSIIFVFKDGSSSYCQMDTQILQDIYKIGCPIVNVENLAWLKK
jgi:hypothetical protein